MPVAVVIKDGPISTIAAIVPNRPIRNEDDLLVVLDPTRRDVGELFSAGTGFGDRRIMPTRRTSRGITKM
jgi:hypothetical protein